MAANNYWMHGVTDPFLTNSWSILNWCIRCRSQHGGRENLPYPRGSMSQLGFKVLLPNLWLAVLAPEWRCWRLWSTKLRARPQYGLSAFSTCCLYPRRCNWLHVGLRLAPRLFEDSHFFKPPQNWRVHVLRWLSWRIYAPYLKKTLGTTKICVLL